MVANSYVPFLSSMYSGVLSDVTSLVPALAKDCDRDLNRLLSLLETRGHHFAMVCLPAFGKHFDRCLANGHLLRSRIDGFRPYRRRGVIPCLFKGLLLRVFEESGNIRKNPCLSSIRALRQLCRLSKRFRVNCDPKVIEDHIREFVRVDEECSPASLPWDDAQFDSTEAFILHLRDLDQCEIGRSRLLPLPLHFRHELESVTQQTLDIVSVTLGSFDPYAWNFRHGPGAVADAPSPDWYKYQFRNWDASLERVFPYADFAFANYGLWVDSLVEGGVSDDPPISKLIAVPKVLDSPRLIASEPLAHQWCQQNLRDFMYKRVQHSWLGRSITFRDQTPNQVVALRSSLSGSHATIDLSQASDRISCWLVERLFRRNPSVLSALQSVRTNHVRYMLRSQTYVKKLRKYSTMGSAVTFPIQSILFLGLVLSAVCIKRQIKPTRENLAKIANEVRVFGDDIVVPIDCADTTVGILHLYGLKVNISKTFRTGMFRESCGVEGFAGHDVSCAYILGVPTYTRPESIVSAIDSLHNLCSKGWVETARRLQWALPKRFVFASTALDSGSFGIPDILDPVPPLKMRRNKYLQYREVRCHVPTVKSRRGPALGGPAVLQYFTEACEALFVQGERIGPPLRSKISLNLRWVEAK